MLKIANAVLGLLLRRPVTETGSLPDITAQTIPEISGKAGHSFTQLGGQDQSAPVPVLALDKMPSEQRRLSAGTETSVPESKTDAEADSVIQESTKAEPLTSEQVATLEGEATMPSCTSSLRSPNQSVQEYHQCSQHVQGFQQLMGSARLLRVVCCFRGV